MSPRRTSPTSRPRIATASAISATGVDEAGRIFCLVDAPDAEAANRVQRAHEEPTRLGATAVAHRVALRLRELRSPIPRGPRPTTRANPRGLTEREWEIAGLLALGLSNAEIAGRLVVSPKTVGHHVSAVLAKLEIRRRAEVAVAMREVAAPI